MGEAANKSLNLSVLDHFDQYREFANALFDAFVVVDRDGLIVKNNLLFSRAVEISSKKIVNLKRIDEILNFSKFGSNVINMDFIAGLRGSKRFDEVKVELHNGKELNLIVGIFPFVEEGKFIGAFMLMRDVTAELELQNKYIDRSQESMRDTLTGLYNRKFFMNYLSQKTQEIPKYKDPNLRLCLLMFDLDHFKKTNDNFGHLAGDFVLKNIADILNANFRKNDVVGRYGGEEFVVIIPEIREADALTLAEKLRHCVDIEEFKYNDTVIPVTISIGVSFAKSDKEEVDSIIQRADDALYVSKKSGRNRVTKAK